MIVVFLGPPGAGKGTQCKRIAQRYGLRHLSSGDVLRREKEQQTELGEKAQAYMDSGQLVPDDLIVAMMVKEMDSNNSTGCLLDGFPRTLVQARGLDDALQKKSKKVALVLNLEVDDDKLEQRITGRRSCPRCGAAYHVTFNPPRNQGRCDVDDAPLTQRSDDTPELVRQRIKTYHEWTAPLIDFYRQKSNLRNVDGNGDIERVTRDLYGLLDRCRS